MYSKSILKLAKYKAVVNIKWREREESKGLLGTGLDGSTEERATWKEKE